LDFKITIFAILGISLVMVGIEQQVFGLEPQFVPCLSATPGTVCRDLVFSEPPVNEGDSRFSWFDTNVNRFHESHLACYVSTFGLPFSCSPETKPPTLADTSNRIVGYNAVRPGVGCVLDLPTWMTRGSNPVDFTIPWSGGQNIVLRDIDIDAGQKGAVNNAIIGTIYHPLGLIDNSKLTTRELALDPATLRSVTGGTPSQNIQQKQFLAFELAANYGPSAWKDYIPVNHVRTLIWWGHSSITSGVSEKWDFHETHGLVHVIDQVPPVITSNNLVVQSNRPDGKITNQIVLGVSSTDQCALLS